MVALGCDSHPTAALDKSSPAQSLSVHDTNRVNFCFLARSLGAAAGRTRGSIDEVSSGALRVRVYAGLDPVSNCRHGLIEIVPSTAATRLRARDTRVE